jgi:hypothetical protein
MDFKNHPDIVEYDERCYNFREVCIRFNDDELLQLIKKVLSISFNEDDYDITELSVSGEEKLNYNATKKWSIEFYSDEDDEYYSTNIIEVLYSEGDDANYVALFNCGTSRTRFCRNILLLIKYFITSIERKNITRYVSREQLLLFISGSIDNYDNFSGEHIQQIIKEKSASKMRYVLENPMYKRELLEYIDYDCN